jgi:DNA-directed RNA polymerase subunit N (RpoN/RPB10)
MAQESGSLYQLPLIECTNCGTCVGHMFDDYYKFLKQLTDELLNGYEIPRQTYITKSGDDIGPFLRTYYTWKSTLEPNSQTANIAQRYTPSSVMARALLRSKELDASELPFGSSRDEDGQLSPFEVRICCARTLQTDPTGTDT